MQEQMDKPKAVCPTNIFKVGGIIKTNAAIQNKKYFNPSKQDLCVEDI